jgi:mannose/fructose-specific phosphotransferase system component IIA
MKVSTGNEKINIVYGANLPLLIEAALAASNDGTLEDILGKVDLAKQYSMGIVANQSANEDEDDF